MNLQQVLDTAIEKGLLTPKRIPPMRTAVKQFAAMLGTPADQLTPERYHLPKDELFHFIEQHIGEAGLAKRRNTKNNLAWLLALAVRERWLRPPIPSSLWEARRPFYQRDRHHGQDRWVRPRRDRPDGSVWNDRAFGLLMPIDLERVPPGLRTYKRRLREGLQLAPQALLDELQAYGDWCKKPFAGADRPARIKKRDTSLEVVRRSILGIGGWAVHIGGMSPEEMTLSCLTQPALVEAFVSWWVNERRGRVTRRITRVVIDLQTIARYWLKDDARFRALHAIHTALEASAGPVWSKDISLVPLKQLEEAGLILYPFNPERLQRNPKLQYLQQYLHQHLTDPQRYPLGPYQTARPLSRTGTQVMLSLLLRFLIRLPLRNRNIREMQLGRHLKLLPDGGWEVHFRGADLKIGARKHTGINEYRHRVPDELIPLLQEWLEVWRPQRLPAQGSPFVFLTATGKPFDQGALNHRFAATVYRLTGIRTSIHMVRDSVASELLTETGDVALAADLLGDTVQVVLQTYAHILKTRTHARAKTWFAQHLGERYHRT